jgi:hypothetical protein
MGLTRRGLLGRAAAASGALLGGSLIGPRTVFAGGEGEQVFELTMPPSGGLVESPRIFELIGIRGAPAAGIEVRARGLDGRWTEWLPVHAGDSHGPDSAGESAAARGSAAALSDPVWTGPAHALEIRARGSLRGARAVLVDSGRPAAAAAAVRYVDAGLPAGGGQPRIIARSTWATAACRPRVPAVFGAIDLAFVHHTVSSNAYRPSQSAAMVRSICLFHKYGNGWNDIGYNFVVDRYGRVFEGRAGGIDEAIVGAQAGGYNVYSSGVALLGNFSYGGPPRKAFDALARLLAWKLALHGIPLPGNVTVKVTNAGAPYSRYRAGARVRLNRIAGHRDADTTACPGAGMYRQLPRLRQTVRRLVGSPASLTCVVQAAAPGSATVGGTLTQAGLPIAGATVEVQRRSIKRGPATLATAVTDAGGNWSTAVGVARATQVRAVFRGDAAAHPAVVSNGVLAITPPQVTLAAATGQTPPGGVIQFTGGVTPVKPRVSLVVAQQQADGTFLPVRTIRLAPADDGTFARTIGFADPGQYQVIAHAAADRNNALGTSAPVFITVA